MNLYIVIIYKNIPMRFTYFLQLNKNRLKNK